MNIIASETDNNFDIDFVAYQISRPLIESQIRKLIRQHEFNRLLFVFNFFSEGKVGKSSILLRFVHDQFNKNHLSTVQASFMNKKINFDNKRINLNIWDTAGQEIFHALGELSMKIPSN